MANETKKLYGLQELLAVNGGPLPISRAHIYNLAARSEIPIVKIGTRCFVPSWYIDQLLMPPTESQGA